MSSSKPCTASWNTKRYFTIFERQSNLALFLLEANPAIRSNLFRVLDTFCFPRLMLALKSSLRVFRHGRNVSRSETKYSNWRKKDFPRSFGAIRARVPTLSDTMSSFKKGTTFDKQIIIYNSPFTIYNSFIWTTAKNLKSLRPKNTA